MVLPLVVQRTELSLGIKGLSGTHRIATELGLEPESSDSQTRILPPPPFPNLPQRCLFFGLVPYLPALFSTVTGAKMKWKEERWWDVKR